MTIISDGRVLPTPCFPVQARSCGWLLVALVLHSMSILCRVRIWQRLLCAALERRAVPFGAVVGLYLASLAVGLFVPLRGGDAVRVAFARRTLPEAGTAAVVATLAAEAIPGLVVVPLLLGVALLLGVLPVSPAVAAVVMAGGLLLVLAAWRIARVVGMGGRGEGRLGRVLVGFASGLRLVGSPARFARIVGPLVVLDWTLRIASMAALLAAFQLGLDAPAAVAVVSIDSLTTMIPVLPDGAGAQQAAIAGALHAHASTTVLLTFSTATQLLVDAVNVVSGVLALTLLRSRRPAPAPVAASVHRTPPHRTRQRIPHAPRPIAQPRQQA